MWHQITKPSEVPSDREVRLAVINADGAVHALVFPCRRSASGWIDSRSGRLVEVFPTHWQDWSESSEAQRTFH
jgi:hypothetical protein